MPKFPQQTRRSIGMRTFDRIRVYDPSKPMTSDEVADFLGFTTRYVYQLAAEGKIPSVKIGRRLFFSPRAIYELAGMGDYIPADRELI